MRILSNEIFGSLCIVVVFLSQFVIEAESTCNTDSLLETDGCGENERCITLANQTGECKCIRDFQRIADKCVPTPATTQASVASSTTKQDSTASSSGGSVAAGLLIPLFLISLAVLIFLSGRRYKWVQRFRQYQQNRYGNVLVTRDEDDDDPPIV